MLFFIDGASLVNNEDDDWELLLAVRQAQDAQGGGTLVVRCMPAMHTHAAPSTSSCLLCLLAAGRLNLSLSSSGPPDEAQHARDAASAGVACQWAANLCIPSNRLAQGACL